MDLRALAILAAAAAIVGFESSPTQSQQASPTAQSRPTATRGPHKADFIKLKFADAKDIADVLRAAFGPDFYAAGDPVSQTVLINGPAADIRDAKKLVLMIDVRPEPKPSRTDTYYELKYPVPNPVSSGTIADTSGKDLLAAVQAVMLPANASPMPDLRLALDPSYPRILLTGTTSLVVRASSLLETLDQPPALIQLEARVYELDEQVARNVGISIPTNSIQTSITEYNPPGAPGGTATPMPALALAKIVRSPFTLGTQLNFLIANGYANLVSEPRVATLNGRLAILDVSDKIPYVANAITNGGVLAPVVYDYTTGTHLEIVPTINQDGTISAYLHPVYSTLTSITNQGAPEISKRETSTTLKLRPGESVVISGLESQSYSELVNTPFKHIPILNALTKSKTVQATRAHVFIVLTPTIVDYGALAPKPIKVPAWLDAPPTALPVYQPYGQIYPGQSGPDCGQRGTPPPGVTPVPCPTAAPPTPEPQRWATPGPSGTRSPR